MKLTPKKDICLILQRINTKQYDLDKWYCGALHALANQENPDRFSQAAHSLRELMEKLVACVLNRKVHGGMRRKKAVTEFYEKIDGTWLSLHPRTRQETVDKFRVLRKELENIAHHNTRIQEENKFKQHIEQLEEILSGLEPDIEKSYKGIEKIIGNYRRNNEE